MDDWTKAVVSTGLGFAAGLFAEPVKIWLGTRAKVRAARAALYSDMGRIYHILSRCYDVAQGPNGFESTSATDQKRAAEWIASSKPDVFAFYSAAERAVFYGIPEYQAITEVYASVADAVAEGTASWAKQYSAVMNVFQTFDRLFKQGALDSSRLLKYRAQHRERTVTQLTQYHRLEEQSEDPVVRDNQYVGGNVPSILVKPKG
jgi:hypothetical protein